MNELIYSLMEDAQFVDIMCADVLEEKYDTSGKKSTVQDRLKHSNAYNVVQTNITDYVNKLSKCSTKKEVDSLYNKHIDETDKALEQYKLQVEKFKKLGRDDESKLEKEGLYNNAGFKMTLKGVAVGGILAGVLSAFNPVLSLSASAITYVYALMDTVSETAAGIYMYNKWLKAEGKTITNKVKNKLK